MIRLFTTVYPERDARRRAEYAQCLHNNLACPAIDEVCVLREGEVDFLPETEKLRERPVEKRPLYDDFFAWINEVAGPEDVSIIANTDVWFDASIGVAAEALKDGQCIALARWDDDELFDRNDSQDCWIFRGRAERVRGDFPLGVPRCDNRMLYELQVAGYEVLNPAFSIRSTHLHAGERKEDYRVPGPHHVDPPYRYLFPHNLYGPLKTLAHNLRHPDRRIGWRFDRRRALRTLPARAVAKVFRVLSNAVSRARGRPVL